MGTRNLTAVMLDGKYVIAQYGQFDGHPDRQGKTALGFCGRNLRTKKGREKFKEQLHRIRFIDDDEVENFCRQVGAKNDWLTSEQSDALNELVPYLSRDHGAKILNLVLESDNEEILLVNNINFAADSLYCEYAYVIDLDKNTFEAYKGFNKEPLPPEERFANIPCLRENNNKYYPVKLKGSWNLNSLPSLEELCDAFKEEEDE